MIGWAIETLLAASLLMLLVLAIRGPVARWFGPHIAYGLWLLPALRMVLPPLPAQVAPAPLAMLPTPIDLETLLMLPRASGGTAASLIDWPLLIACAWGAGAIAFLAWHLLSYRRFVQATLAVATPLPRLDRDGVEVCASPRAPGPFAAGIFLKTIVLPADYRRRYAREELRLAIEHEVQHHRRCDMSASFAALVMLALHWWNPIAYLAHRAFRVDLELACDAAVLARATPAERHAYGAALLKSACGRLPVAACALGAGDDLKRRLKMMKNYRSDPARSRAGGMIAGALIGGGLLLTASGGIAAETSKRVEDRVRTALAPVVPSLVPPTVPAVPAPTIAPKPVKLALAGHPHPAPPAPPIPALPPTPPVPPIPAHVDGDEISRQVRHALDEARHEVAEAQREASMSRIEALQEAAEARREALRDAEEARREGARARANALTQARAATQACSAGGHKVAVAFGDDGHTRMIGCRALTHHEQAEIRRSMLTSLQAARASIAAVDARYIPEPARAQALRSVDQQIERIAGGK